jgi:hypothetical protein
MSIKINWPEGKSFAFTVFDDADNHLDSNVNNVYSFLNDLNIYTTKSIWPNKGHNTPICGGLTCEDEGYIDWIHTLQKQGFEIGYHLATYHSSLRDEIYDALEKFKKITGHDPFSMSNHALCKDTIYWGAARLSNPFYQFIYRILNIHKDKGFSGQIPSSPHFWGDYCRERIKYVRGFTYKDTNTLKVCPFMPYHDSKKEFANYWYASTEGPKVTQFTKAITPDKIDKLEEEGGLCIMYTHFGWDFSVNGKLNPEFQKNMEYLAGKNCWFAPVHTILDYLQEQNGIHSITSKERNHLERTWLKERFMLGST